eukprot:401830_1
MARGAIRDIRSELNERLKQLITHPKYAKICKFHEINFGNDQSQVIQLSHIDLFVTFDGAGTKRARTGKERTQVHLLFGGLHEYWAGSPMITFMILDIGFTDKNLITKKAMRRYVVDFIEQHIHHKVFTINILQNTKRFQAMLHVDINADRPAIDGFSGVLGHNSWAPVSDIVIYDVNKNTKQFIDVLSPTFTIQSIASEHTYSWEIKQGKMPSNRVRVHIADIPGFEQELKQKYNELHQTHFIDYDHKPLDVKSKEYKQFQTKHKHRKDYAHNVLGIPVVYTPSWFVLFGKLYDVLHFGIVKSGKIMSIVATQILLLERVDIQPFIDIYLKSKVSVSFGKQW